MGTYTLVFIFIISVQYCPAYSAVYQCPGVAPYSLSFYGMWSNMTHPFAFPTQGLFSPLIGCSHGDSYTMWGAGMKATPGVKAVAETGNSTTMKAEIATAINTDKTAWKLISTIGPINNIAHVINIAVEVTQDFPYVSLITMLAPSPDWFTGIMKTSLCDSTTGKWKDSLNITMLSPWDAGTDSGITFTSFDLFTDPPSNIVMITKSAPDTDFKNIPGPTIPTLGKLMFQRTNKPALTQCSGEQTYKLKFEALWSQASHPNGFPSFSLFSPLVIATHTYRYKFWSDMTRASPGVKIVAETGAPDTLYNEILSMKKENVVLKAYKGNGPFNSPGETSMEIMVKDKYSILSLITMISPSPDWFVGIDSYDLCGSNGKWKDNVIIDLLPWDAGTDSGLSFVSDNDPTLPVEVITRITESSNTVMKGDASKPFARLTFEKFASITTSSAQIPTASSVSSAQVSTTSTPVYPTVYQCPGVARYSMSFYGMWSNMSHPNAFPTQGHFSPLVGCSHEDAYTMWDAGMKASQGVTEVAETGNSTALETEIRQRIMTSNMAWKLIKTSGPIIGTSQVTGIDVEVTKDFPLVSLISMIAPSPDWFTGIMKESLCNSTDGTWLDSLSLDMLVPWDAGTDDGITFADADLATVPPDNIAMITKTPPPETNFQNIPGLIIPTLGKLMFQMINKPILTQCNGVQTYKVTFEALWSQDSHPNGFPSIALFSPLVIATHTYRYKFWSDMTRASPGVKIVAKTGNPDTLYNEILSMKGKNFVYEVYKGNGATISPRETSMEIIVKDEYSIVSLISMIAPSPDWFVGVDSYDLCRSDGKWKDNVIMNLLPWDAGTDSGTSFTSANIPTIPYDVIKRITGDSNTEIKADANKPFARLTFEKSTSSMTVSQSPCTTLPTKTPTDNSAKKYCCDVSLVFFSVAVMRNLF